MIVADIMTRQVLAIDPQTPLEQAIRLMTEHRVSGLPVVERNGELAGMLTEGDLLRRVETGTAAAPAGWFASFFRPGREAEKYVMSHARRVGEVMTGHVISVNEDTPLADAVTLMQSNHIKRLPVVRDGKLCGIISRADLVRQLGRSLEPSAVSSDDQAILTQLHAAMQRESWAGNLANITVKDGVVELDGCLFDMRAREALGVLAENIPGVKRVENRIACIEPYTGMVTYDPSAETV